MEQKCNLSLSVVLLAIIQITMKFNRIVGVLVSSNNGLGDVRCSVGGWSYLFCATSVCCSAAGFVFWFCGQPWASQYSAEIGIETIDF